MLLRLANVARGWRCGKFQVQVQRDRKKVEYPKKKKKKKKKRKRTLVADFSLITSIFFLFLFFSG